MADINPNLNLFSLTYEINKIYDKLYLEEKNLNNKIKIMKFKNLFLFNLLKEVIDFNCLNLNEIKDDIIICNIIKSALASIDPEICLDMEIYIRALLDCIEKRKYFYNKNDSINEMTNNEIIQRKRIRENVKNNIDIFIKEN